MDEIECDGRPHIRNQEATGSIPVNSTKYRFQVQLSRICYLYVEQHSSPWRFEMASPVAQNYANHVRFDPLFHFFALPVVGLTVIAAIVHAVQRPNWFSIWLVVFSVAIVIVTLKARLYALRLQDRLIRLEERVRLERVLNGPLRLRVGELGEGQLVALRFCCDAELQALVEQTLGKNLSNAEIKKSVKVWRPDYFRV